MNVFESLLLNDLLPPMAIRLGALRSNEPTLCAVHPGGEP